MFSFVLISNIPPNIALSLSCHLLRCGNHSYIDPCDLIDRFGPNVTTDFLAERSRCRMCGRRADAITLVYIGDTSGDGYHAMISGESDMCNLYSHTKGVDAIRKIVGTMTNSAGNVEPQPGIYPDQMAPVVINRDGTRDLAMLRWGMPSWASKNMNYERGITNVRNLHSPWWRKWLGQAHRCVVPFNAFAEPDTKTKQNIWFEVPGVETPVFAGIWVPQWRSVRKVKEGQTVNDLFAFLTTEANSVVGQHHPRAMPVILTTPDEVDQWFSLPVQEVEAMQRPLPDEMVSVVDRG